MLQDTASAVSCVCKLMAAAACLMPTLGQSSPDALLAVRAMQSALSPVLLAVCAKQSVPSLVCAHSVHQLGYACTRRRSKAMTSHVSDNAFFDGVRNSYTEVHNQLKAVCYIVCSWHCLDCRLLNNGQSDDALALLKSAEKQCADLMCPAVRANHTLLQGQATAAKWQAHGNIHDLESAKGFTTALTHFECARAMCPRNSSQVHLTAPCMFVSVPKLGCGEAACACQCLSEQCIRLASTVPARVCSAGTWDEGFTSIKSAMQQLPQCLFSCNGGLFCLIMSNSAACRCSASLQGQLQSTC